MASKKFRVTKLEAAQRQLRTAIELWVEDKDEVAIHSLAFAAYEIIHTIFRKSGHSGLLFDSIVIKDEYRTDFAKFMKKAATFFKHAQKDPNATLEFNPALNDLFLFMSVAGLQALEAPLTDTERVYLDWMRLHNPSWFTKSAFKDGVPVNVQEQIRSLPKSDYFKLMREIRRDASRH